MVAPKPWPVQPSLLPPGSSPDIKLVEATPVEYDQTWHLNGEAWAPPLSMPQYFTREQHLKEQALTKDNQITCWILTSPKLPDNPDGTHPILASCETLLGHAYVARDGVLTKILAHGIGSVYTRPEHRGKGYASRMMAELGKILDTWQQRKGCFGTFSVLYSDIGTSFYNQQGWKAFPSTHITLAPIAEEAYTATAIHLDLPSFNILLGADLHMIPTIPNIESELVQKSTEAPGIPHVAIRPDGEHFGWQHAREEIQCSILGLPAPTIKGAAHEPTGVALIWTRVFNPKPEDWQLVVLRTHIPAGKESDPEVEKALAALLLRAQLEATRSNMATGVEVWSPEPITLRAARLLRNQEEGAVQVITRDKEHICSLRWAESDDQEVVWVGNEKYAWC